MDETNVADVCGVINGFGNQRQVVDEVDVGSVVRWMGWIRKSEMTIVHERRAT